METALGLGKQKQKMRKMSEQIVLLQTAKESVTSQLAQLQVEHRADQQKLNDTQQQLAMMHEHASQQAGPHAQPALVHPIMSGDSAQNQQCLSYHTCQYFQAA